MWFHRSYRFYQRQKKWSVYFEKWEKSKVNNVVDNDKYII